MKETDGLLQSLDFHMVYIDSLIEELDKRLSDENKTNMV